MTKPNGHIKDPKEMLELNKKLQRHYAKQHQVQQDSILHEAVKDSKEKAMAKQETVDHPEHYNHGSIEAITVIEDWNLDFHLGNVVKYICRSGKKEGNEVQDLEKALWYLQRKIKNINSQE